MAFWEKQGKFIQPIIDYKTESIPHTHFDTKWPFMTDISTTHSLKNLNKATIPGELSRQDFDSLLVVLFRGLCTTFEFNKLLFPHTSLAMFKKILELNQEFAKANNAITYSNGVFTFGRTEEFVWQQKVLYPDVYFDTLKFKP